MISIRSRIVVRRVVCIRGGTSAGPPFRGIVLGNPPVLLRLSRMANSGSVREPRGRSRLDPEGTADLIEHLDHVRVNLLGPHHLGDLVIASVGQAM